MVLGGTPLTEAARVEGVEPADLDEAVEIYQRAGRLALEQQTASGWWQLYIHFTTWSIAEQTFADHIAPILHRSENDGSVAAWWFVRKHPCWRVRLAPGPAGRAMKQDLAPAFDALVDNGLIAAWWSGLYEAETAAFGGRKGMDLAHELFCADSRAVVNLLRNGEIELGRRELSLLLCSSLMRAAGVEWYEQGDVWHRIAQERHTPDDVTTTQVTSMAGDLKQLLLADTSPTGPLLGEGGPLAPAATWADAFRRTGHTLGTAARAGTLQRGLRDVLAYAVIFHWNRLGLTARTQSILACAARAAILGPPAATRTAPARTRITAIGNVADQVARRFPLIPQGRRGCSDLESRVREVRRFADSSHKAAESEDRVDLACSAWNLAALIAADCNMHALAVDLCQRQFQLLRKAWPVSGRTAIAAIQPLINLARLTKRADDPETAYQEFEALNRAVHHGGTAVIHGVSVIFDGFTNRDSPTVSGYLQKLLREEGTRALTAVGDWGRAAAHAAQYDDSKEQLREARQTRIISHILDGNIDSAHTLLDASTLTQPWERAVTACIRRYANLKTHHLSRDDVAAMVTAVQHARQPAERSTTLFRIRLGQVAAELAAEADPRMTSQLCAELNDEADQSADAFAAREVLDHQLCWNYMTANQAAALTALVEQAQLGSGSVPESLLNELLDAVHTADTVLVQALGIGRIL